MFKEEIHAVATSAAAKFALLKKNPLGYLISSALAGAFIGFGVLLAFTAGGLLSAAASPLVKIVMGLSFGIALSLVVMAGAELFTGNNFVMAVGIAKKTVRLRDALLLWAVCWLGNLIGAVLLAFLFHGTGLNSGAVGEFIAASALTKTTLPRSFLQYSRLPWRLVQRQNEIGIGQAYHDLLVSFRLYHDRL